MTQESETTSAAPAPSPWIRGLKIALGVMSGLLVLVYPVAVFFGLSRFSVRAVAAFLLVLLLPGMLVRLWRQRGQAKQLIGLALSALLLIGLAMVFNDERFMRAYPVVVSAVMLSQFGWTLFSPPSMIERFARMQVKDLIPQEVTYCRSVTMVWCGFFIANGAISGALAIAAGRKAWALYTGLISYVLMGILFAVEFVLRKYRFRHHAPANLLDRIFARIFPPESPSTPAQQGLPPSPPPSPETSEP